MAEETRVPDSCAVTDIDATMSRMVLLSSKKKHSVSDPEPDHVSASDSAAAAEDALNQVDQFLREALEKPRERISILRMEQDVEKFLRDFSQQQLEFQALPTSYLRLAAHRIAQHYNLHSLVLSDSNLSDGSGSVILLRKTPDTRFPAVRLADVPVSLPQEDVAVRVAIKQRPIRGPHNYIDPNARSSSRNNHPKTVDERKEEYNRARARIFRSSGNSSSGMIMKQENESTCEDSFQYIPVTALRAAERSEFDGINCEIGMGRGDSSGSSRINIIKAENDRAVSRHRPSNRVAIFRDHEMESKDPDYNRSYDRYMQRFDPGFGYSRGPYTIQPFYTPGVNYRTEFPHLVSGHRPHILIGHQPRSIPHPQHLRGPWPVTSVHGPIRYGLRDVVMSPFNLNQAGPHPTSPMLVHSSQYPVPLHPGMSFVLSHEHVQPFAQAPRQQYDVSYGLARPR